MSQHDYVIDNANGAAVRVDLNNVLAAIQSNNSGGTSPTTTTAFQWWFDSTANDLKMRNSGDTAWVSVFDLTGNTITPFRGTTLLGDAAEKSVGTVLSTNLPNVEDIQNQQGVYLAAAGSVNAFTLALIPAIAGYVEGQLFGFKANLAITAAPNLNVNSKGAGAITWPNGDVLVTGDILINQHVTVRRTASAFVMLGSRTVATQSQAEGGTQTTRIMSAQRVLQSIIANPQSPLAGSVNQVALKTGTGDNSTTSPSAVNIIMPGGEYGLMLVSRDTSGSLVTEGFGWGKSNLAGTTFSSFATISTNSTGNFIVRMRFIQASPPYDLGDGIVQSFIFLVIDNSSNKIITFYHAPDPPWANNGPTDIRPDRIDLKTGKLFKKVKNIKADKLRLMDPDFITEKEIEITSDFKNSDMILIPHPFGNGEELVGKTVVLLDPMSPIVERMEIIKNSGDDITELLYGNYLKIGNEELNRARPPGVMSVSVAMK